MTPRLYCLLILATLWAAITLPAGKLRAFSPQDYEGSLQLGEWQGSVGGGYQFEDETTSGQGSSSSTDRNRFDQIFKIANDSIYLIDPRLITFNLGFDVDLFQEQDNASQ